MPDLEDPTETASLRGCSSKLEAYKVIQTWRMAERIRRISTLSAMSTAPSGDSHLADRTFLSPRVLVERSLEKFGKDVSGSPKDFLMAKRLFWLLTVAAIAMRSGQTCQ